MTQDSSTALVPRYRRPWQCWIGQSSRRSWAMGVGGSPDTETHLKPPRNGKGVNIQGRQGPEAPSLCCPRESLLHRQ